MSWEHIIPLVSRGRSLAADQNFLSMNEQFYVMDNHRAALWCWLQCLRSSHRFNFLHIDAHWDCLDSIDRTIWDGLPKSVSQMSIQEYLGIEHPGYDFALFRWDNYRS